MLIILLMFADVTERYNTGLVAEDLNIYATKFSQRFFTYCLYILLPPVIYLPKTPFYHL